MTPIIYPYNLASETAKSLAENLNTKRVRQDGNYVYRPAHLIINYGNSHEPNWAVYGMNVLNNWNNVQLSVDKLRTFNCFRQAGVSTVDFTTDIETAKQWITNDEIVVCRTILNSHSGNGIVIAETIEQLVSAPLYTKYFNGKHEYRLHFFNGKLIDFTQKKRNSEIENPNDMVRSYDNGWIFARENVALPSIVVEESRKAIKAIGLDFGAIDIRYKVRSNTCAVLEVNSAPNLVETTLNHYLNAFNKILNNELIEDIDYGNFSEQSRQPEVIREISTPEPQPEPIRAIPPRLSECRPMEQILYDFPNIQSLSVVKIGDKTILKVKVNGIENNINI